MKQKRLILFDIDGTLLRTKGVGRAATRAAMLEVFGTASRIDQHVFGGKTDWATLLELLEEHGQTMATIRERMPEFAVSMSKHLARLLEEYPPKRCPGALETVEALRDDPRYILGIVTGNTALGAPVKLRAAGYDPAWFPVGGYGSEAHDRGDLPRFALERARALCECPIEPQDTYVIGDTPMDIAAARAVGAVAVGVTTGFTQREELVAAKPDYLFDRLTDLLDILAD